MQVEIARLGTRVSWVSVCWYLDWDNDLNTPVSETLSGYSAPAAPAPRAACRYPLRCGCLRASPAPAHAPAATAGSAEPPSASSRVARRSTVLLAARLCAARRTAKRRRRRGYLCTGAEAWVPAMALASGSPAREMRAMRLPEAPRRAAGHTCAARVACRPRCRDRIRRQPSATGLGR